MPVLDHKPVWTDCDDKHHTRLVDRQQRNNNDASPVFASLPIGSAVVVQWEDGGPWTHGTVVSTGDHNHHNQAYTIQLTTSGKQIICNRQHIKPTSVRADAYLQYHAAKQSCTRTDPLADILNNINNNPAAYTKAYIDNNDSHSAQCNQQTNNTQKGKAIDKKEQSSVIARQETIKVPKDKRTISQDSKVFKTRSRQIVRKLDRLVYT